MYRRIDDKLLQSSGLPMVSYTFDGRPMTGLAGETVAASLLSNGVFANRTTPVSGSPRAPYCMMGVCFDCLVVIDGVGNRQGCLTPLEEGMIIESQMGKRRLPEAERK